MYEENTGMASKCGNTNSKTFGTFAVIYGRETIPAILRYEYHNLLLCLYDVAYAPPPPHTHTRTPTTATTRTNTTTIITLITNNDNTTNSLTPRPPHAQPHARTRWLEGATTPFDHMFKSITEEGIPVRVAYPFVAIQDVR
jgi:hypothetical protein